MSVSLKDVLTSPTTFVKALNTANKGGTYIKIKCHKVQIPQSLRKDWECIWFKISNFWEESQICYDNFSDEIHNFYGEKIPSENYRIVEMIFKESMFDFFHNVLNCQIEHVFTYDLKNHMVVTHPKMTLCDDVVFEDRANTKPAKPCKEAREVFVHALLTHEKHHPILRANYFLIEKCRYSDDVLVANCAKNFKLSKFYLERVGDVLDFSELNLENFNLTPDHLASKAMDTLSPLKQNIGNWAILSERFADS